MPESPSSIYRHICHSLIWDPRSQDFLLHWQNLQEYWPVSKAVAQWESSKAVTWEIESVFQPPSIERGHDFISFSLAQAFYHTVKCSWVWTEKACTSVKKILVWGKQWAMLNDTQAAVEKIFTLSLRCTQLVLTTQGQGYRLSPGVPPGL